MKRWQRSIAVLCLLGLLVGFLPGNVYAGDQATEEADSTQNNEVVGPSTNYNVDQIDSFASLFKGRAESISPANGGLTLSFTDLTLPGRNGLDFVVKRTYQSNASNAWKENTKVITWKETVWVPEVKTCEVRTEKVHLSVGGTTTLYKGGDKCSSSSYEQSDPVSTEGDYVDLTVVPITIPAHEEVRTRHRQENLADPKTFLDQVYGLGLGWSFGFPVVEKVGSQLYYHDGVGGSILVNWSVTPTHLAYPFQDLIFDKDSGTFTNAQGVKSAYALKRKDGFVTYFAADGRLLAQKDRYGNTIQFEQTLVNDQQRISKVTDTIGRVIQFTYAGTRLTIAAPGNRTITYNLTNIASNLEGSPANKYLLSNVVDPVGRTTAFAYTYGKAQFDFLSKTFSAKSPSTTYVNLTRITYPGGGEANYTYTRGLGNLGASGLHEVFRVTERSDKVGNVTANRMTYAYNGSPDGYPTYKNPAKLPSTYTFNTEVTMPNGTVTKHVFSSKGVETRSETTYPDRTQKIVETQYDSYFLPTKITATSVDATGKRATSTVLTTHDKYGDLLTLIDAQNAKTTYTYDPKFHQIATVTRQQNSSGAVVETRFTINSQTGNIDAKREVHREDGVDKTIVTTYLYDAYGNVAQESLAMADGTSRTKTYEYGSAYQSAYQTSLTEVYTAGDGTDRQAVTRYDYDFNTGLVTSFVDPMGARTTTAYDADGRVLSLVLYSVTGPVAATRAYSYDDVNLVSHFTDENGHVTDYVYDQLGRLVRVMRGLNGTKYAVRSLTYDTAGVLAAETDANGHTTSYQYDGTGRVTKTTYPDGSAESVAYDDVNRRRTLTDPNGNVTITTLDAQERPVETLLYPTKGGNPERWTQAHDYQGNKVSETDPTGAVTYYQYDDLNRPIKRTDALRNEYRYVYNNAGDVVAEIGPDGRQVTSQYDPSGRLLATTDPLGGIIRYAYDAKGRRTAATDPLGRTTLYTFDDRDRLISVTDPAGFAVIYTYDAAGNRTSVKDPRGGTTQFEYDEWNRRVSQLDPLGNRTRFEYDRAGNQVKRIDALGHTTTYEYDARNRLVKGTNALGVATKTITYDGAGNKLSVTDGRNNKTTYVYDGLNRLVQETNGVGAARTTTYDSRGNITRVTDGNGNVVAFEYDPLNRLVAATDAVGARWSYAQDAYGNILRVTDPSGRVVREDTFDPLNRRTRSVNAVGTVSTFAYDAAGNLIAEQPDNRISYPQTTMAANPDQNGVAAGWALSQWSNRDDTASVTAAVEDQAQKLTVSNHAPGADGVAYDFSAGLTQNGSQLRWAAAAGDRFALSVDYRQAGGDYSQFFVSWYDASGKVLHTEYGPKFARATTWQRQAFEPSAAPAETATMSMGVLFRTTNAQADALNGSAWFKNAQVASLNGGSANPLYGLRLYTYDARNQLTAIRTADVAVDFAYDEAGNRTRMTDGTGTTTYAYDVANRLTVQTEPGGKKIAYEYSPTGRMSKVTDYGNALTEYQYDSAGRLSTVRSGNVEVARLEYDLAGNRTSLTRGDVTTTYGYDAANRLVSLVHKNGQGAELSRYGYEYDKAGNLAAKTDLSGRTQYGYDADNRLTLTVLPTNQRTEYAYDRVGNRTRKTEQVAGRTLETAYTYDAANRLTQVTGPTGVATYTWDGLGNQVSDGTFTYRYDALNRLVSATSATRAVNYRYNGDGLLVGRTESGKTTRFYLNGPRVINEGNDAGTITATMTEGAGEYLSRKVGSEASANFLHNGHGDVTSVRSAAGTELAGYDYDPFGELTVRTGAFDNPYLYAGEYYDSALSVYNLRARYYSPGLGRFLTQDTYQGKYHDPMSLNLYAYVKGNPLTYVDPTGHSGAAIPWNDEVAKAVQTLTNLNIPTGNCAVNQSGSPIGCATAVDGQLMKYKYLWWTSRDQASKDAYAKLADDLRKANPGGYTVQESDKLSVRLSLTVSFEGGTAEQRQAVVEGIKKAWSSATSPGITNFNVTVDITEQAGTGSVVWYLGGNGCFGRACVPLFQIGTNTVYQPIANATLSDISDTAAHEYAHVLGLPDMYDERSGGCRPGGAGTLACQDVPYATDADVLMALDVGRWPLQRNMNGLSTWGNKAGIYD